MTFTLNVPLMYTVVWRGFILTVVSIANAGGTRDEIMLAVARIQVSMHTVLLVCFKGQPL